MLAWALLAVAAAGTLCLTWLVYPWSVLRRARKSHPPPSSPLEHTLTVSVILATREPSESVRERILDLLSGDWPADLLEIVVAVDGDPTTYRFENLFPTPRRLLIVAADAPGGKACALNSGVRAATGEVLIFTDTHQRFAVDAIRELVTALCGSTFDAVSGALELGGEAEGGSPLLWYWTQERRLRAAEARVHSTIGVSGSIYAMRRSLWTPLPSGLILDDLWVPMSLVLKGHRIGFEPKARAVDTRVTTAGLEFQRKVRTLTGNLQLVAWMPALLLPWRNPVWGFYMCHKLLRFATPYALAAFAAGCFGFVFTANSRLGWAMIATGLPLTLFAVFRRRGIGNALRHAVLWGVAMQGATVVSTWNGLRGRWDVWRR